MLVELAGVLRRADLPVVERDGWRERGHGEMGAISSITLHHTAGPKTGEAPSLPTVENGRPDLEGPLAHLVLGRSGVWFVIAAGLCWHTGATLQPWQSNAHAIGIEAEATGRDPWPDAQYASYVRGARALADHYGVPYAHVLGHKEICSPPGRKIDPNLDLVAFRAALHRKDAMPETTPKCLADPASAVWQAAVRNTFGDVVSALQVLNGIERRLADLQTEMAAVKDRLGG